MDKTIRRRLAKFIRRLTNTIDPDLVIVANGFKLPKKLALLLVKSEQEALVRKRLRENALNGGDREINSLKLLEEQKRG
jgi:hypothetical protein